MFQNILKKELNFMDSTKNLGIVKINSAISFVNFMRPIIRNKGRELVSVGRVNYALLDQFVMTSLNHYYSTISSVKDQKEVNRRITEYNELYNLWYKVNVARQNHDLLLNSYYDDIVYKLYLLGYRN